MRQAVMLLSLMLGLALLAGCRASDPMVQTVDGVVGQMRKSTEVMRKVSGELTKAVSNAKKDNKKITKKDLSPAVKSMEELRAAGGELVDLNEEAKRLKAKATPEQAENLRKRFQVEIKSEYDAQEKAGTELKQAADEIRKLADNQETIDYFNEELRTALQEFESVTREK